MTDSTYWSLLLDPASALSCHSEHAHSSPPCHTQPVQRGEQPAPFLSRQQVLSPLFETAAAAAAEIDR